MKSFSLQPDDSSGWEPLKLDRDDSKFSEAIDAAEAALAGIESSNGYAINEPEERNAIVASVKGTIEATKTGTPSREMLVHGLFRPLKYLAEKFRDTAVGEFCKIAVARLLQWLPTLFG